MTKCNNHYVRVIECSVCGSQVKTANGKKMCDECAELRRQERQRARRRHYVEKICKGMYVIVFDPIPPEDGGFERNARFDGLAVSEMIKPNIMAFTVGTILTNYKGELFIVKRKSRGGEEIVRTSGNSA